MKFCRKLVYFFVAFLLVSCGHGEPEIVSEFAKSWGKKELYRPFLWKDYPQTDSLNQYTQTLEISVDDGDNFDSSLTSDVVLELVEEVKSEKGEIVLNPVSDRYLLLKNGSLCKNNLLVISPNDKNIIVSIQLNAKSYKDDTYYTNGKCVLRLRVLENGGYDWIGNTDVRNVGQALEYEWILEQVIVTNPLKVFVCWTILLLLVIVVIVSVLYRINYPKISVVVTMEEPCLLPIVKRSEGVRKVLLTSKRAPGKSWNLFKGKTKVVKHSSFVHEITMVSASKGVRVYSNNYSVNPSCSILKKNLNGNNEYHFSSQDGLAHFLIKIK